MTLNETFGKKVRIPFAEEVKIAAATLPMTFSEWRLFKSNLTP